MVNSTFHNLYIDALKEGAKVRLIRTSVLCIVIGVMINTADEKRVEECYTIAIQ